MKHLIAIQKELKAPKGQYNSFGKYKYRSAEDILEAVKPLLAKEGCTLTLSDELKQIGDRYYVCAVAKFNSPESEFIVCGFAREEETKKGMDGSQITGTASSYARKYALNGLFLIDDTKDADTDEYKKQTTETKVSKENQKLIDEINEIIKVKKFNPAEVLQISKASSLEECDTAKLEQIKEWLASK